MSIEMPSPHSWNATIVKEDLRARRFHTRGTLKIKTPVVPEPLRKRWHGMPPTKLDVKRLGGTIAF